MKTYFNRTLIGLFLILMSCLAPIPGLAQEAEATEEPLPYSSYENFTESAEFVKFMIDNLWILIAAALVFLMHLGFASVEAGLTQAKNTVNILFKNVFIICMGVLSYALWGFHSMYPDAWLWDGVFALGHWITGSFAEGTDEVKNLTAVYENYTYYADFIFQAMFAATAATIVSGAVAERMKLGTFMIGALLLVTIGYPITGSWKWGEGWLDERGFQDFAGSTLVHGFGGFAALAAVILLGPRRGKFLEGRIKPIPGHSMPLATIGVFLLFLGWFGFNGGSVLSADPKEVSFVFVTTALAGCAGGLAAAFTSWGFLKKPDLSMALNGMLAGLVGITAGADVINPMPAILVGAIAGAMVVASVILFDKIRIDDPVGAISVHGVCGIWGTLAVGIFGADASIGLFLTQLMGAAAICIFAFVFSFAVFGILRVATGLRVSSEEEFSGLDVGEHGIEAYPAFVQASE